MKPLEKTLRNQLERTVKEARDVAEAAAAAALEQLGIGEATAYSYLSDAERELRRKLRVHGRQLGDERNSKGVQGLGRLIEEVAYEHWHRMLFARFLAENNLLMYPDPDDPVAVTLEECEDLAADEGASNGWELAARYAARMLPQIFRPDSPVFKLHLPREYQLRLEQMVAGLAFETFMASDSLGWIYQFWQAKKKDEVNASDVKIGARELPAVTQLFTEDYMVSFLLDNSLGAWWAARRLSDDDLKNAVSEEVLRAKASIAGVPLEYLRFVKEDDTWTPAAGTFDVWPNELCDLKTMDPCCGSGHFLVAAFLMLVPMRMELDGLSARKAVNAVLSENIHGLELDQRCVELAAFALALTAWKYPEAGGYRPLPEFQVACSGLSVSVRKEEWLELAEDNQDLRYPLEQMYDWFSDAPVLGSLLNPRRLIAEDAYIAENWNELGSFLEKLIGKGDDATREMGIVAHGLARATNLLNRQFHLVMTNVPYLSGGKLNGVLSNFIVDKYPLGDVDLAMAFMLRCLDFCNSCGVTNLVLPRIWMTYTKQYEPIREYVIKNTELQFVAPLGKRAFATIGGEIVDVVLLSLKSESPSPESTWTLLDASLAGRYEEKVQRLVNVSSLSRTQSSLRTNPGLVILMEEQSAEALLEDFVNVYEGLSRGDAARFDRFHWEMSNPLSEKWKPLLNSAEGIGQYFGRSSVFLWEEGKGALSKCSSARVQGLPAWDVAGIFVSRTRMNASLSRGDAHAQNGVAIIPKDPADLAAIFCFCQSGEYRRGVENLNQKLIKPTGVMGKVPFDSESWRTKAQQAYPKGLPLPYTNDPRELIFHGHPCGSVVWDEKSKWTKNGELRKDDFVLQVAVARLLGYRWPAEFDKGMELAPEQRAWVNRCESLLELSDEDGIVCIPPVRGEAAADGRLLNLLAAAYGDSWSKSILNELLKRADHAGKSLEGWLRDKFFMQHCKLFQHRPFIWQIWDGLPDGFSVLVNYHKLDYKLLETLTHTYLGDWILRCQERDRDNGLLVGQDGEKTAVAKVLKRKLEHILRGESPNDIFIRWKSLAQLPLGWNPDLEDGVRLNIRPFVSVGDVKKKGAGILKDKPNLNWDKDNGRDDAPIYSHRGQPAGTRFNDKHIPLSKKRAAQSEGE